VCWRTHPPSHISLDRLAVTTHCFAPSSLLVVGCGRFGEASSFLTEGAFGLAGKQKNRDSSIRIRHTKNADALIQRLPGLVDVRRSQFIGGLDELRQMAATPCSLIKFRKYITEVFADQLSGTVNDIRDDKSTERPKVLEDFPCWPSLLHKFQGEAIGSDLRASNGSSWAAYQAVTEYLSHESRRAKQADQAARQRFE